jgi:Ca2+-transporting ATPase
MVRGIRSGKSIEISVFDLLVGDVLHLEPGDVVPADGVLISSHAIRCDESSLTGESRQIKKVAGDTALERLESGQDMDSLDPFILSGSKILEGIGTYLVTGVGVNSSYGRLWTSLSERTDPTPLQQRLSVVADRIAMTGVAVAALLFLVLSIKFFVQLPGNQDSPYENVQTFLRIFIVSITIVVIAVPEGLPLAVTLALAIAVTRMLKDNNLVRILAACETMGNVTTVCCDKTGTLTMNKMRVTAGIIGAASRFSDQGGPTRVRHEEGSESESSPGHTSRSSPSTGEVLPTAKFCSLLPQGIRDMLIESIAVNSTAFEGEEDGVLAFVGSKTEAALLTFARDHLGMPPLQEVRTNADVVEIYPFDSSRKSMAVVTRLSTTMFRIYVKGAPEILLSKSSRIVPGIEALPGEQVELSDEQRSVLTEAIDEYASQSLRTLGLAYRDLEVWPPPGDMVDEVPMDELLEDMIFLGVLGIQDPLRPGVAEAVKLCQHAGVYVRMVTGDNRRTAQAIARQCGILDETGIVMEGPEFRKLPAGEMNRILPRLQVLARSSPEDKKTLVRRLKELGETVAVTGDGTNDGPAMRAADIGLSMGLSGTEVAKDASSIVLMDDNFSSIVKAIEWGRTVNDVIKKFLHVSFFSPLTTDILGFTLWLIDNHD